MSGMNQGKDPPLNLIHKSRADANAYIGRPGQMTLLGDFTDGDTPRLVEARFHNGLLPGGFIMPLTPAPQGNDPEMGPAPRVMVVPPENYTENQLVTVTHNFGYFPVLHAINNAGSEMWFNFVHLDENRLRFTADAGVFTMVLR